MTEGYTLQYDESIEKIVEQLETLLLNRILSTLKDLNYPYEPLRSVSVKKTRDDEPPF